MSATIGLASPFDPIAAEWSRKAVARRAIREPAGPVGYRGGPLPGLPGPAAAPSRWRESLMRWLAEMPRDLPPRD